MDTWQLTEILTFDAYVRETLHQVCAKNNLTRPQHDPASYVVNLDDSHLPGSHWIAMFIDQRSGTSEYFDPATVCPPIPECLPILNLCPRVLWNHHRLQDETLVCGQYCVMYLLLRNRGMCFSAVMDFLRGRNNDRHVYNIIRPYFPNLAFRPRYQ